MISTHETLRDWHDHYQFIDDVIRPSGVAGVVVSAFEEIDRGEFVPDDVLAHKNDVYGDKIINITEGTTISQPSLVAKMTDLLNVNANETVLEIGTATGYQAALLSRLARRVDTVELNPKLADQARDNLKRLSIGNVTVYSGSGIDPLPDERSYDAIIVTAQLKEKAPSIIGRLAVGGRLVAPVGDSYMEATLMKYTKISDTRLEEEEHGHCYFVPYISEDEGGWNIEDWQESVDALQKAQLAEWRKSLSKNWEETGKSYEEMMENFGHHLARILGRKKPLKEIQSLEIIIETLRAIQTK